MFNEDNNGFVLFPHPNNKIVMGNSVGKTLIYLVAFEPSLKTDISNVLISLPGSFFSDDVISIPDVDFTSFDSLIVSQESQNHYDKTYFPHLNSDEDVSKNHSVPFISSICIGWSNETFQNKKTDKFWFATFRDLTNEGKRLYYAIKKLHNNKEVRILTFNNI